MRQAVSVDDVRALFASQGLRTTAQRLAVFEYLRDHRTHPTAATIFEDLSRHYPTLSRATVYNTVDVLVEMGLAQRLDFGTGTHRYDGNPNFHAHLVCSGCGDVVDVEADAEAMLAGLEKQVASPRGFQVQDRRLELFGLCRTCAAKSAQPRSHAAR